MCIRDRAEDVRTCYQRDIDRIVHSKSFRRLMHKTQVFLQPEGDHYRTRMTHTLEVSRIAGTITRALGLNEDLAEAIAMGHDLGHTPFGHAGEDVLSQCLGKPFRHNEQSLRVVDILEKDGQGDVYKRQVFSSHTVNFRNTPGISVSAPAVLSKLESRGVFLTFSTADCSLR